MTLLSRMGRVGLVASAVLLAGHAAAGGDDLQAAGQLFRAGRAAYEQGEYAAAARSFELAYVKAPRTPALYAAAVAWESAGEPVRAAEAFKSAVEAGDLPEPDATTAKERLQALSAKLGYLRVEAPAGVTLSIARLEHEKPPIALFLPPGRHELTVERPDGMTQTRSITLRPGQLATLEIAAPSAGHSSSKPAQSPHTVTHVRASTDKGLSRSTERTFAWVALGGAAVAAGATVYLGLQAKSARDAWEGDPTMSNFTQRDRAASLRGWTNVSLAAAGALGAAGFVLWISSTSGESNQEKEQRASVVVTPEGGSFRMAF